MKQYFTHVEMFGDNTIYIELENGECTCVSKTGKRGNAGNITPKDCYNFCQSGKGWKEITEEEALSYHDRPEDWYVKEQWYGVPPIEEKEKENLYSFTTSIEQEVREFFSLYREKALTMSDLEKTRDEWFDKFTNYYADKYSL